MFLVKLDLGNIWIVTMLMGVPPFHCSDKFDPSDFKIKPKASKLAVSQTPAEDAGQTGEAPSNNAAAPEKVTTNGPSKTTNSGSKAASSSGASSIGGAKTDAARAGTSRPKRSLRELLSPAARAMFSMKVSCWCVVSLLMCCWCVDSLFMCS